MLRRRGVQFAAPRRPLGSGRSRPHRTTIESSECVQVNNIDTTTTLQNTMCTLHYHYTHLARHHRSQ
jgi:hypothetical protein